jgi:uncharacterized SAM-binding protein YcdF (DUF218 family)
VIADAIVVLGCRVSAGGALAGPAARRVETAARVFRAGVAPVVIASGGRRWGAEVEAIGFCNALVGEGVPRSAIAAELVSLSTVENAVFSAAILRRLVTARSRRRPRAAIVTCPWHMPRALASFTAAGVDAIGAPTESVPMSILARAYLALHELASERLDAHRRARAALLTASADAFFADGIRSTPRASRAELSA